MRKPTKNRHYTYPDNIACLLSRRKKTLVGTPGHEIKELRYVLAYTG